MIATKGIGRSSRETGLSLVEMLVVLIVISIIVGIVAPLLAGAKSRAQRAQEMQVMRQLGQAAEMYIAEGGHRVLGAPPLVQAQLIKPGLLASPLDTSSQGVANVIVEGLSSGAPEFLAYLVPYKSSYIGPREFGYVESIYMERIGHREGAGWLVSLSESSRLAREDEHSTTFGGVYLRLLNDGSVGTRRHFVYTFDRGGTQGYASDPMFLFFDATAEEMQKWIEMQLP